MYEIMEKVKEINLLGLHECIKSVYVVLAWKFVELE